MTATPPSDQIQPQGCPTRARTYDTFQPVLAFTLKEEGGWSDDRNDAGGPTHFGITLATFREIYSESLTAADLRSMSPQTATAIYRSRYWRQPNFYLLPAGVSLVMFDFGVNAGPGTSAYFLQMVIGTLVDGVVGPVTIKAAFSHDAKALIDKLTDAHQAYYRTRPKFSLYGDGWIARTERARSAAYALLPSNSQKAISDV